VTETQWLRAVARINRIWPHQPVQPDTVAEWFRLVCTLSAEEVDTAITVLELEGKQFPPSGGEIARKVLELRLDEGTTWAEVWSEILRRLSTHGHQNWDEIPWSSHAKVFMQHVGREAFRQLGMSEESELSVSEAQWRGKWEAWRQRALTDAALSLISDGDGMLRMQAARRRRLLGGLGEPTAVRSLAE